MDAARQLESNGEVLHVSLVHGFPWSDVEDAGAAVIVVTDNDAEMASKIASQFARDLWEIRDSDLGHYQSMTDCLDTAGAATGPVVIADAGDNPGAGTGSDTTWLLHEVLQRKLSGVAMALYCDPVALGKIVQAGEGATVSLNLGGYSGPLAGVAVSAEFEVVCINDDAQIDAMPGYPAIAVGTLAAVRLGGVQIVVGDYHEQVFGPRVFTSVGIDPGRQAILIVKSAQHFYRAFAGPGPQDCLL